MKALKILGIALLACSMVFVSCKKDNPKPDDQNKQYTITVKVNDEAMGMATGGGTYAANTSVTLKAFENQGYRFVKWQDGNTSNPRTITVTKDETYTAVFEAIPAGVYVEFGPDQWKAGEFLVDANTYAGYGKLFIFIFKTTSNDLYPQFQGLIPNTVGTTTQSADNDRLLYVGSASEVDAEGHVQWSASNLETIINAIDLNAHTITAIQTANFTNSVTSESRDLKITYQNAEWIPAQVQSKGALIKF